MIPTRATDAELAGYVANIVTAYRAATPDQLARGRAWYPVAHDLAGIIADGDYATGAGIIAALSPNKSWSENQRLARDAGAGYVHGHFADSLAKVQKIMAGADPATVLPMELKTGHFYRSIADPTSADAVVIDRHAHDVAVGQRYGDAPRGLSNKTRYATLALAYRLAARQLGELPLTVQAVTWVRQVDMNNGTGDTQS